MRQVTTANVEKAVAFFTQAGLSRLLAKLREKYIELGKVGGQILLEDSTANERREIASFFGKAPYREANFKVRLVDIDTALRQSGFACTLPDLLAAFFPDQPLVTRPVQRAAQAAYQADFHIALTALATALPEGSRGQSWLVDGLHGLEWLFSRYKNTAAEEQQRQLTIIHYIADVLNQLPQRDQPERLALFAQRTSGDPHALDPDRTAGRLFLFALNDLATDVPGREQGHPPEAPQARTQQLHLYRQAGLLVDTISSSVAVFNLAGAVYHGGTPDPLLQTAGERVLLLPLRQLLEWQSIIPAAANIYVIENPQVFEEVIAEGGGESQGSDPRPRGRPQGYAPTRYGGVAPTGSQGSDPPAGDRKGAPLLDTAVLPTLVCTSGWPSVAALTLLDLLLAQSPGNRLHYSGDFDVKGLQIAAYLMARYAERCQLWHFDTDSYAVAMQTDGVVAPASELALLNALPEVFSALVALMQETKKWAYQEGITHVLTTDVRNQKEREYEPCMEDQ